MAARKTVLEIIQSTTSYFEKHGVESPRLNAQHLVAHVLKVKRIELYMDSERELFEDELAPLRDLVKRRSQGVPLQHLLGTEEFYGRTFKSDARALVPRPETERLIELILPLLKGKPVRVVDVGTGSGIIALTLAAELPEAEILAIDFSPDALALATENAALLDLTSRVTIEPGDLLSSVTGEFQMIVANLPYIPAGDIPGLAREVQHDPVSALDGGEDGLDLIRRLIDQAPGRLAPGGTIALEIGHDQSQRVADLLRTPNFRDIRIETDYQGVPRFLIATHG
ncbi:MAG TPA: peptide chain release factor N(5)-glutamine methyltransferase [Chthoniobacterales bacterium]|jgi:release factor glutamine methyltransferase